MNNVIYYISNKRQFMYYIYIYIFLSILNLKAILRIRVKKKYKSSLEVKMNEQENNLKKHSRPNTVGVIYIYI